MGRRDVPYGFYIAEATLDGFDFYTGTSNITYESQKIAKPTQCKTCKGEGFIVIDQDG